MAESVTSPILKFDLVRYSLAENFSSKIIQKFLQACLHFMSPCVSTHVYQTSAQRRPTKLEKGEGSGAQVLGVVGEGAGVV